MQPCPWGVREALILLGALLLDVLTGPTGIFLIPATLLIAGYYLWKIYGRRLTLGLMYYTCGYGERPEWIAGWSAGVIALFAILYWIVGIGSGGEDGGMVVDSQIKALAQELPAAWKCLYFSVITFTSLGYADLVPAHGAGRILAAVEAATGFVLMSLLLVTVARKFSR